MDWQSIWMAVMVLGGVGLLVGAFLGLSSFFFKTESNPKEEEVLQALPGNNCGGCGYPGCAGLAKAIVLGEAQVNACPVGGNPVAEAVANIMGVQATYAQRKVAYVHCAGNVHQTTLDYEYTGIPECRMLGHVPNGGPKSCNYGCVGYGSCVQVCEFDAMHLVDGIAQVEPAYCTSCGKCVEVCPKNLISLIPAKATYVVTCSSCEKGPVTMKQCKVGCIACGICVKACPQGAITIDQFCAKIDQSKCIGCGICAEKCPRKIIRQR